MIRRAILFFSLTALLALPAAAQQMQQRWVQMASGTGFFINRAGDVITNAHVVRGCQSIALRLPTGDRAATLTASDTVRDLAVLKTNMPPPAIAPLRWNISDLKVGDPLYIYGFPGRAGANGTPTFLKTNLSNMTGPSGQPEMLQLETPGQQGNSGGPVLDSTGNVIAVVSGRAEIYEVGTQGAVAPKLIGKSGIAITLSQLRTFLNNSLTGFYETPSGLVAYAEPVIANNAAKFTFPVLCVQGYVQR